MGESDHEPTTREPVLPHSGGTTEEDAVYVSPEDLRRLAKESEELQRIAEQLERGDLIEVPQVETESRGKTGGADLNSPDTAYFQTGRRLREDLARTRPGSPEHTAALEALKAHNLSRERQDGQDPATTARLHREAGETQVASRRSKPVTRPSMRPQTASGNTQT